MLSTKVKNKEKADLEGRKDGDLGFEHAEFLMCGKSYFQGWSQPYPIYHKLLLQSDFDVFTPEI